jgi:hypothetical protein
MSSSAITRRDVLLIALLALVVGVILSALIRHPGYTDAYYYFNAAKRLVQGQGLTDLAIWSYIGLPAASALPAPSHLYWMPLTSFIAAAGMIVAPTFDAAQIAFVPFYVALVIVAAWLGAVIGGSRRSAWLSALVMLASGYFMPFWFTSDAFAVYGVVGSLALIAIGQGRKTGSPRWFALAGMCIGFAHLARNDGVLQLPILILVALWPGHSLRNAAIGIGLAVVGYLLIMTPWFLRNLSVIGAPLPIGGFQAAWMREYNELFNYPAVIDVRGFLAWELPNIVRSRLDALISNSQTFVAVEGVIVLAPFMLIGLWRRRMNPLLSGFWLYALALHAAMTLIFPLPGVRGGLFHSAAALMPFWAALGIAGFEDVLAWAAKRRRWSLRQARLFFTAVLMLWLIGFSAVLFAGQVTRWNDAGAQFQVARVYSREPIMINDPAAYHYFTGGQAVVLPNAPVERLPDIFERFGVSVLVVDENIPAPLQSLWLRQNIPFFLDHDYFDGSVRVYRFRLD